MDFPTPLIFCKVFFFIKKVKFTIKKNTSVSWIFVHILSDHEYDYKRRAANNKTSIYINASDHLSCQIT